jgi:hypothetical protein
MNATESFKCARYALILTRGRCADMFGKYGRRGIKKGLGRKQHLVVEQQYTFGKSMKAAAEKCSSCPVGEAHARGIEAVGCPTVATSVVTFRPKPFKRRICVCGDAARPGSRTCSLACATAHVSGPVEVDVTDGIPERSL